MRAGAAPGDPCNDFEAYAASVPFSLPDTFNPGGPALCATGFFDDVLRCVDCGRGNRCASSDILSLEQHHDVLAPVRDICK